ncbi:MAG: late competence development ComFB family protein [Oscillospiraceae bacterium]|nr:late competence development ComFB family protein [Oscillospiraceae bacterium]MDY6209249.1 late competence development ComFB family protein [Oscillospiraceae bacterium]
MLVNANEEIVKQRLPELLKEYDCCKCEKCVCDMMAIALNNIKPAYVNTSEGMLFKRINSMLPQKNADIDIEILKAINLVSAHPKHSDEAI